MTVRFRPYMSKHLIESYHACTRQQKKSVRSFFHRMFGIYANHHWLSSDYRTSHRRIFYESHIVIEWRLTPSESQIYKSMTKENRKCFKYHMSVALQQVIVRVMSGDEGNYEQENIDHKKEYPSS